MKEDLPKYFPARQYFVRSLETPACVNFTSSSLWKSSQEMLISVGQRCTVCWTQLGLLNRPQNSI